MAGNVGHPFFGNQYANSSYTGGYHYDWKPNLKVSEGISNLSKTAIDSKTNISLSAAFPQNTNKILPIGSKISNCGEDAMIAIIVVSAIAAVGTGSYYLFKHLNKNSKKKKEQRSASNN